MVSLGYPNSPHDPAYRPESGHRKLVHLSTGEIFREQIKGGEQKSPKQRMTTTFSLA